MTFLVIPRIPDKDLEQDHLGKIIPTQFDLNWLLKQIPGQFKNSNTIIDTILFVLSAESFWLLGKIHGFPVISVQLVREFENTKGTDRNR